MDRVEAARALVRDEGRLRRAQQAHRDRLFDLEAATTLRNRLEDTLETIHKFALDDTLWHDLELGSSRLGDPRTSLEDLIDITWTGLPPLLEAFGYASPPPPPASELVDETVVALTAAFEADPHQRHSRMVAAQGRLVKLRMRALTQIEQAPEAAGPSVRRRVADSVGRTARALLPVAIGGSVGVAVESFLPGTGLGMLVGKSGVKLLEKGLEIGAGAAMATVGRDVSAPSGTRHDEHESDSPERRSPFDPIHIHRKSLDHALSDAQGSAFSADADELRAHVARARRHLDRLLEIDENDGPGCGARSALDHQLRQIEDLVHGARPCWSEVRAALAQTEATT